MINSEPLVRRMNYWNVNWWKMKINSEPLVRRINCWRVE
jgi:hypothetical protein